jgi:hypothetical protein
MNIADARLQEFQEAYKMDFGEDISEEEAREMLSRLVTVIAILARPLPKVEEGVVTDNTRTFGEGEDGRVRAKQPS